MEKDYKELYERITNSEWFKKAYHNKSLGECPIVVDELEESEDERIRKGLIEALKASKTVGELKFILPEPTREECIAYLENLKPSFRQIHDSVMWDSGLRAGIELGKRKEASKAIEAVDRIDKYIDENLANAHDMKDSNPDKKYYRGWDDALGKMAGILQDVYSEKENKFAPRVLPSSAAWFEDGDEKQEPAEDWREQRKKECPFRQKLDNNLYGCERYADVFCACDGNCSWVVDYPKLKEIQDRKEQEPINESNMHEPTLDEARKWNEAYEKGYSLGYENGRNEQKPTEKLSKEEYVKKFKILCDAYEIKLPGREYDIYGLCEDLHKLFGDIQKPAECISDSVQFDEGFKTGREVGFREGVESVKPAEWNNATINGEPIPTENQSVDISLAEWSEEDETHRAFILESLEDQIRFCKKDAEGAYYAKQIRTAQNWLKSLRPSWKPSKEQMEALYNVEFKEFKKFGPMLESLYNDLKKL